MIQIIELIGTLIPLLYLQGCLEDICDEEDLDECGVCNGDGIKEGSCDCDNNILDCAGICNGNSICEIATVNDLLKITSNNNYILINDIDFDGITINPLLPDGYIGTFDGDNFEIKNFIIDLPEINNVGLFAENNGTIKNLGISGNCSISGASNVGGIVGYGRRRSNIINCYNAISGDINGNIYVGGLVGSNLSDIKNSYISMNGSINGNEYVGGICGHNIEGDIDKCFNIMIGSIFGNNNIGGLIGYTNDGVISNCYNGMRGNITEYPSESNESYIGGIIGQTFGASGPDYNSITNCYNTMEGNITGYRFVGGVIGYSGSFNVNVSNCYNAMNGSITGIYDIGGIIGYNQYSNISNCYISKIGSVTGTSYYDNIIGDNENGTVNNCYDAMDGWNNSDAFNETNDALINDNNIWYDFDQNPQTTNIPYGLTVFTVSPWVGYNSHNSKPTL